jgi:hypothetical protein
MSLGEDSPTGHPHLLASTRRRRDPGAYPPATTNLFTLHPKNCDSVWVTTRRKAVRTRGILALLVVLALFMAVTSLPAGSAPLQQLPAAGGPAGFSPSAKDGDGGEDIDGGDDDRWGTSDPDGGQGSSNGEAVDDEEDDLDDDDERALGRAVILRIELRALFGFLVILL